MLLNYMKMKNINILEKLLLTEQIIRDLMNLDNLLKLFGENERKKRD